MQPESDRIDAMLEHGKTCTETAHHQELTAALAQQQTAWEAQTPPRSS